MDLVAVQRSIFHNARQYTTSSKSIGPWGFLNMQLPIIELP